MSMRPVLRRRLLRWLLLATLALVVALGLAQAPHSWSAAPGLPFNLVIDGQDMGTLIQHELGLGELGGWLTTGNPAATTAVLALLLLGLALLGPLLLLGLALVVLLGVAAALLAAVAAPLAALLLLAGLLLLPLALMALLLRPLWRWLMR